MKDAFAVWVTGLPAAGKSTVCRALVRSLAAHGARAAVLESDVLRPIFTPNPAYTEAERDVFYGTLAHVGSLLTEHGVPVIFDATANRREYRDRARRLIPRFFEVYVACPLEVCIARDPKGLYRMARMGRTISLPGVQAEFEPPLRPDFVVHGDRDDPDAAARRIVERLIQSEMLIPHGGDLRRAYRP